jgi:hypothetical protein
MNTFENLYRQYLLGSAVHKELVDALLNPDIRTWPQFDPEVGYILGNSLSKGCGIDGSSTITTCRGDRRTPHHYAGMPCRINTYGNSFTECNQVSDGETWQEYLAAHFGEPIGNYGVGGFGVYQAYRKLLRAEKSPAGVKNVILYIWGDDHQRSIMRCRHAAIYTRYNGNVNGFWANIEMDLPTGRFVEKDNLCPTPQSVYKMCDPEFMADALRDDLMVQICFCQTKPLGRRILAGAEGLRRLAKILDVPFDLGSDAASQASIDNLYIKYGYAATKDIVARTRAFTQQYQKNLLVVLFDPIWALKQLIQTGKRQDQEIVDYLQENDIDYFDMNLVHLADFKYFNLSEDDYYKRYLIGHYNPAGNHFFAFAIKDRILAMLDPKPITYRNDPDAAQDFEAFLKSNL